jgi:hypothetical protein
VVVEVLKLGRGQSGFSREIHAKAQEFIAAFGQIGEMPANLQFFRALSAQLAAIRQKNCRNAGI